MRRLALLCLLAFVGACGGDDDEAATSSTTSTTERPSSTTSSTAATPVLGDPVELDGVVVGVHPAEAIAYVSIIVPGEIGCEGGDVAHLFAQPLPDGEPVDVVTGGLGAGAVLLGGRDGRVAVVDQCEGFLSRLSTATPEEDGTFTDVQTIDTSTAAADGQLQPGTIRWGADGASFVALVHDLQGDGSHVVRIHLDGTVEDLGAGEGLLAVEELGDGRLVLATGSSVTIDDQQPIAGPVTSLALQPARTGVAIVGPDGIVVADGDRPITDAPASVATWAADGSAIAYLRVDGEDASAWLHRGEDVEVSGSAGFGAPLLTADGRWVVYDEAVDTGQGFREPRARARAIS